MKTFNYQNQITMKTRFGPMAEGALKEFQVTNFDLAITGIFD
ncbi:hypothetical protein LB467_14470 [Salegentibacter sp. JZCK2]|nr:hypothetical protein [Salegentibacter tibetensis]MBZ9730897.1 hypothetical protein [Salegentibacter tibetensis]